ncbi:MAG: restriction endonuclease subunit S [Paeniclostridium sordellii]|nr:restriction endonuclease subunit S [[Eubacterium] tenue]MDU2591512.1 restriction endonuclease subunit S [Paeniclostridium sordellii]
MSKTPKLRFKEFSGDWESKRLGNCVEINSGGSPTDILDENGTIPYFKVEQLNNSSKYQVDTPYRISNSKKIITSGSIIFPKRGATIMLNKIRILAQDSFMDTNLMTLTVKKSSINNEFLYTYLLKENLSKLADTTSIPQINNKHIEPYEINIPSKEEQEKIASFFSLIDDKISLQGEKVEALKDYKKGMMQKIFSRELRFKDDDGRDYPEWEEKKLNQLGDTYTGLSGKTKENFGIGDAKYVIYRNVFGNILAKEEELDLVEINKGEKQNKVIKGDLLFTTSSETPEEVGMISCWNYDIEDLYLNSFCFGYRLFNLEQYSPIFMAYLLRSEGYRRKISILGQGSTRYNISKTELMKMKVSVPNIEEQRKIVSLLLGLESNIEKNQEKLDSLKEYKKGLLQQMFI